MKKLSRLLVVFFLSLVISACGTGALQGSVQSQTSSEAGASVESTIGGIEDTAWDDGESEPGKASQSNTGNEPEDISQDSAGSEPGNASQDVIKNDAKNASAQNSSVNGQSEESAADGTGEVPEDQEKLSEYEDSEESLPEDGTYTTRDDVALYIHLYGKLPSNFITKKEAEKLGWEGGSLEPYAPGKCIGGSRFGNYEGLLPEAEGRFYTECDIDTLGARKRGAKRIVFSNDGLIYYTEDHYESFELLYGEE